MSRGIPHLLELYESLPDISGSGDLYVARTIGHRQSYRVARDPAGNPTILVAAAAGNEGEAAPVELTNLSFRPRCHCRIRVDGTADAEETLAVLKCTTDDPLLRQYFLRSVSGMLEGFPDSPTEGALAEMVGRLAELFRALESPARSSLQGIWCELFLIASAPRLRQAAVAWHADPRELHDFVAGRQRVEVKSSTGLHRSHRFLLDQLLPQEGTTIIVASFVLDQGRGGKSITELWDDILDRDELTPGLRNRLAHILALALGSDWRRAERVAFDPQSAADGLRFYDARTIPTIDAEIPAEITDVRFISDLSGVAPLSRREVAAQGGLFGALF